MSVWCTSASSWAKWLEAPKMMRGTLWESTQRRWRRISSRRSRMFNAHGAQPLIAVPEGPGEGAGCNWEDQRVFLCRLHPGIGTELYAEALNYRMSSGSRDRRCTSQNLSQKLTVAWSISCSWHLHDRTIIGLKYLVDYQVILSQKVVFYTPLALKLDLILDEMAAWLDVWCKLKFNTNLWVQVDYVHLFVPDFSLFIWTIGTIRFASLLACGFMRHHGMLGRWIMPSPSPMLISSVDHFFCSSGWA